VPSLLTTSKHVRTIDVLAWPTPDRFSRAKAILCTSLKAQLTYSRCPLWNMLAMVLVRIERNPLRNGSPRACHGKQGWLGMGALFSPRARPRGSTPA